MDIGKYFSQALRTFRRRPEVALPSFVLSIASLLAISIFLLGSGLLVPMLDYVQYVQTIEEGDLPLTYAGPAVKYDANGVPQVIGDAVYDPVLREKEEAIVAVISSLNTLVGVASMGLIMLLLNIFLSCMHYVVIAAVIKKKPLHLKALLSGTSCSVIRFVLAKILIGLLYLAPAALLVLVLVLLGLFSTILGLFVGFIGLLTLIAYMVFIWLKMIFAMADLFLYERRPMVALNKSYTKTRGFMLQVFVVALIEWILSGFASGGVSLGGAVFNLPLIVILSVLGSVIFAVLFALKDLFVFYAWEDQKNWVQ